MSPEDVIRQTLPAWPANGTGCGAEVVEALREDGYIIVPASDVDWRDLAERLTIEDPWSNSLEGLDDMCQFCWSEERRYEHDRYSYWHNADCVWIEACDKLGRERPRHKIL